MSKAALRIFSAGTFVVLGIASTQAASVEEVFKKYDLLGTFAADCTKPVGMQNLYFVHRVMDADRVQHDQMYGPTTRDLALVIDQVTELGQNQLALSGTIETRRLNSIISVDHQRMRMMESTRVTTATGRPLPEGEKVIAEGRFTNGAETPWLNKCP